MAPDEGATWQSPLKAPAVEVIDLTSDDQSLDNAPEPDEATKHYDASTGGSQSGEESENSLWEDILNENEDESSLPESM